MSDISLDVAFRLIKLLNEHKTITYKTIMDEFNVSRNTAYRYLSKLEQFFPVYSPENGSKAFRLITNLNIDGTAESADFAFIATLLDFAKRILSSSYSKEADAFKQRLFSSSRYQIYHYQTGEPLDYTIIADKVTILEKYILTNTTIDIYYKKYDKRYILNPYRILFSDGNWYLLADHNGILKTLNMYYISDIKGAGKFDPRDEDVNKYMNEVKSIWQDFGAEGETVVLLIHKKMADYFRQRHYFTAQKIEKENKDGSLQISFQVTSEMQFQKQIMNWFPWFKVVTPKKFINTIDELIKQYKEEWK